MAHMLCIGLLEVINPCLHSVILANSTLLSYVTKKDRHQIIFNQKFSWQVRQQSMHVQKKTWCISSFTVFKLTELFPSQDFSYVNDKLRVDTDIALSFQLSF